MAHNIPSYPNPATTETSQRHWDSTVIVLHSPLLNLVIVWLVEMKAEHSQPAMNITIVDIIRNIHESGTNIDSTKQNTMKLGTFII